MIEVASIDDVEDNPQFFPIDINEMSVLNLSCQLEEIIDEKVLTRLSFFHGPVVIFHIASSRLD